MTASRPASSPAPRPGGARAMLNQLRDASDSHRSLTIIVAMAITTILMYVLPGLPPLSVVQGSNIWYDSFANAGVFVLLAMGLNVVIGMAGLLDLGYAAFFAIGAYAYAYSNSPFSHTDRKSTRLNSSHLVISYAVFCLKKKKISLQRALH